MITLNSAQEALKSVYLGVLSEQLNIKANALLSQIKQSSKDVYGKEIIKLAPYGLNGGIASGTEDGNLPSASGHKFVQFKTGLKNLYGTISITDKAIRASASNTGAFVNLLSLDSLNELLSIINFKLDSLTIAKYMAENVVTLIVIAFTLPFRCCCFTQLYKLYDSEKIKDFSKESDEIIVRATGKKRKN